MTVFCQIRGKGSKKVLLPARKHNKILVVCHIVTANKGHSRQRPCILIQAQRRYAYEITIVLAGSYDIKLSTGAKVFQPKALPQPGLKYGVLRDGFQQLIPFILKAIKVIGISY